MSYDNRFQSEESTRSHYPGEEHYYQSEKIKPQPPFYRRYVWQILVGVLVLLVLLIASFTAGLLSRQEQITIITKAPTIVSTQPQVEPTQIPTVAPTQAPTQPPVTYPKLAVQYAGTVHNNTCNCSATLTLTSIVENQEEISGNVIIGPGLDGSGPFTGVIRSEGSLSFTDVPTAGTPTIIFSGSLHSDGSLSGTYKAPSVNQDGTWQGSPS